MPGRVCSVLYTWAKLPQQGETVLMRTFSDHCCLYLPGVHMASRAWGPALFLCSPAFCQDSSSLTSHSLSYFLGFLRLTPLTTWHKPHETNTRAVYISLECKAPRAVMRQLQVLAPPWPIPNCSILGHLFPWPRWLHLKLGVGWYNLWSPFYFSKGFCKSLQGNRDHQNQSNNKVTGF